MSWFSVPTLLCLPRESGLDSKGLPVWPRKSSGSASAVKIMRNKSQIMSKAEKMCQKKSGRLTAATQMWVEWINFWGRVKEIGSWKQAREGRWHNSWACYLDCQFAPGPSGCTISWSRNWEEGPQGKGGFPFQWFPFLWGSPLALVLTWQYRAFYWQC